MSNAITTGKSHRPPDKSKRGMPVFDINTKSTFGVIHNGLTYRQMKGLMSTLEVGGLHHTGMMRRREEITPITLGVARDSCSDALSEEAALSEKKEGTTYKTAVATLSDNVNVETPLPVYEPEWDNLSAAEPLVFCDIETGSLNKDCDILQLGACAKGKTFNQYIMPSKPVSPYSTKVTGLSAQGGVLFQDG